MQRERRGGLLWGVCLLLAFVLVPYFLFGGAIERWVRAFIGSPPGWLGAAVCLCLLLAADIFIPLPSSLVSTAGGYFFGFAAGAAISAVGMSLGCLGGYWLGARWGRRLAERFLPEDLACLELLQRRHGAWAIAAARPLPVLAEASVFAAGVSRMPRRLFLTVSSLANLWISVVYAAVGAGAASRGSFLLAFAGAIALPGAAMWLGRKAMERIYKSETQERGASQRPR